MGLRPLLFEAYEIRKSRGWSVLLRLGLSYLKDLLRFEYRHVFVLESSIIEWEEPRLTPELEVELSVRFVTTNQELDSLLTDGYDIQPISMGIDSLRRRIRKGAIAVLVFVRHELAHWCFMAMNEQAKKVIEPYPYRVDFANQESCSGNAQTAEKYRGEGLFAYATYPRFKFLKERGIITNRSSVGMNNISALKANAKLNFMVRSKGRYLRILWWKSWKETPFPEPVSLSNLVSTLKL